jgi:peptidoglycan/LPS O-acetylase OafA/YrhL
LSFNSLHEKAGAGWRFRPDIEGLRAVAIIGVVLFHAGIRRISGGFLGVDVFFVLSGFLITGVLVAEVQSTGTVSLPAFWARRIRRLLPAATLVSLATLVLALAFDSPFTLQAHTKSAIAFATYWSNLLFVRRGADYFDHTVASDPFLHTWSLAIEEQYYLLFAPLCLVLAMTVRKRPPGEFQRRLLRCAVVVGILSFAGSLVLTASKPLISFYGLPSRAWEFGIGGVLALSWSRGSSWQSRWDQQLAAAGILLIVAAAFVADERTPHPGWVTLLPVLGTALLIHLGGRSRTLVGRFLETGIMRWLGRLSYSWYLWHWPIAIYWDDLTGGRGLPLVLGMPLVSLALAQLTYVTIEAPARHAPWLQPPWRSIAAAAALAMVTIVTGVVFFRTASRHLKDPELAFVVQARDTRTRLALDSCLLSPDEIEPKACSYGDPSSDRVIVLFGDSHAAQWFAALEPAAKQRGLRIIPMTKSGCPSVALTVRLAAAGRAYAECDHWREVVFKRLRTLKPAVVVITNYSWYTVRKDGNGGAWSTPPSPERWREGLDSSLSRLPAETAVLLIEDNPRPGFDVVDCLFKHVHQVGRCAFPRPAAFPPGIAHVDQAIGAADGRVTYLDLTDRICAGPICPAAHGDTALYSDENHLSVRFVTSLSPWIGLALDRIGPAAPAGRGPAAR